MHNFNPSNPDTYNPDTYDCDIVIVGGGLVGASLACMLQSLSLRTVLLEARAPSMSEVHDSFDDKTTALSLGSQRIYETIGLWEGLAAAAHPIHEIHVSEAGRFGVALIDRETEQVPALGYAVSNRVLGQQLWANIMDTRAIDLKCPATFEAIQTDPHQARVDYKIKGQAASINARLVVACDGVMSKVRAALGMTTEVRDYAQQAVVTQIEVSAPISHRAYERFIDDQAIALLPLGGVRYALVVVAPQQHAQALMTYSDAEFLEHAQAFLGDRLGAWTSLGERTSYPLALRYNETLRSERAILLGNAAHTLHPIAAQGFNLGLRDAAVLAECIATSIQAGHINHIGQADWLNDFVQQRQADQRYVRWFTDGLIRWYQHSDPLARVTRRLAMAAIDGVPVIRQTLVRFATGQSGRQPKLMRGISLNEIKS